MRKAIALFLAATLLAACNDNTSPDQEELDRNRGIWNDSGISSYGYHLDLICFCAPEETIVATVINDVVTEAFYSPSGVALSPERLAELVTLDGFFDLIQDAIDTADRVDVTYDATFGFPRNIDVNPSLGIADDEISYLISNFQ